MARSWWVLFCICLNIIQVLAQHRNIDMTTQLGGSIELSCSFSTYNDRSRISWKKNSELIAVNNHLVTSNPRIRLNDPRSIYIYPVQSDDLGTYTCANEEFEQRFFVRLEDTRSQTPPRIVTRKPPTDGCHQMEEVVGRHSGEIKRHLQLLEERMDAIQNQQDRMEHYLKRMNMDDRREITTRAMPRYTTPNPLTRHHTATLRQPRPRYTTRGGHYPGEAVTHRPHRPVGGEDHRILDTPTARLTYANSKSAQEYIWMIRDFQNEMSKSRLNEDHLLKTYFLTSVPGYNMTVRLYPNRKSSDYIAIYAGIAPGTHDRILHWPFKYDYELAIVSHSRDVDDVVRTVRPRDDNCPSEAFTLKTLDTGISCGYNQFLSLRALRLDEGAYLNNGYLYIRIRLFS